MEGTQVLAEVVMNVNMSATTPVLLTVDARGVATATLNRPERGNAYDEQMLNALAGGLERLRSEPAVRALVIRGAGRHFQAGADLDWLARVAEAPPDQAFHASMATTRTLQRLNEFPKPTVAVVHGACFGGGCGLLCCVDVALATPDAVFGLTEVRVGVAPSPISTHMVNAMGLRHTRRYALTGERFDAGEALRIGLVHELVPAMRLNERVEDVLDAIFLSAPGAIAAAKASFLGANGLTLDEADLARLADESWKQRSSPEGREGLAAFRERRRPGWYRAP
jgi:methylglutaconyl-CoA hydratase